MKGIIYLGAAIALLRSVAGFLPTANNNDDNNNQYAIPNLLHLQPGTNPSPLDNAPASPASSNFTLGSPNPSSLWAITYTPYSNSLTCLPPTTIIADITSIARSGFTTIRLYSLDCAILPTITLTLQLHSLTLILGIPLDDGLDSATAQISELISWANPSPQPSPQSNWSLLTLLLLGNEPLFNSHTTPTTLRTYLTTTRTHLRNHGYLGPISVNEPLPLLIQHASLLCPHIDVLASSIHPFFHPQITASNAGAYVAGAMEVLGGQP
ncbi:glycoside hydrolase superfamily [Usnea florida]